MSDTNGPNTSLKPRSMRIAAKQPRMASRMFEAQLKNLFLKTGEKSCLKGMRIRLKSQPCFERSKSRSSTGTTLISTTESQVSKTTHESESRSSHCLEPSAATWECIERVERVNSILSEHTHSNAFIIPKENSWSHFKVTKEVYDALSTHIDIFPAFQDIIMCMGARRTEHEVLPPPPKWRSLQEHHGFLESLSWECSYILRLAEPNGRSSSRPWSLRQFAVYDKCLLAADVSKWVFVSPPDDIITIFQETVNQEDMPRLETDISLHVLFIKNVVACFRPYLAHLSDQVAEHGQLINFADPMNGCRVDLSTNGTRLKLKMLEDDIADALLALRGNQQVVDELMRMWSCCGVSVGTTNEELSIVGILSQTSREIENSCWQAQTIREKLVSCTQIVSSFSELSNGQTLQRLAKAAAEESERTAVLSMRTQRDAAAVKALSVIALVYLPTGVVLNFFSTSLIDLSQGHVVLAPRWWLFLAIGLPLTMITIVAWYLWLLMYKDNLSDPERCPWWSKLRLRKSNQEKV